MLKPVSAFWCRIPSRANFGDALTPWLIHKITGHYPNFVLPDAPGVKYLVTGSIAGLARAGSVVWGAGIMNVNEPLDPAASFVAVRGPLTRQRALACGIHCPAVYGDPALLLPRLHCPTVPSAAGIGLALHFSDYARLANTEHIPHWVRLIDMQGSVEAVIAQVRSCELVVSTSLHGIIVSHAYGIPAVWAQYRPLPSGDGSKFRDYFLSIGATVDQPLSLQGRPLNPDELFRCAVPAPKIMDTSALWQACPFGDLR